MRALLYFLAGLLMQQLPLRPGASGGTYIPREDTFEILTAEPLVKFLTRAVQPPSTVYITNRDALVVSAASSQTGEALTVNWRVLDTNGKVIFSQFVMQVTNDRALNIHKENLPEGFLLSLSVKAAVATTRGQTFARAFMTTSGLGLGQPSYMLMADYVTTAMAPGHPNGRVLAPSEGPGFVHATPPATSALGSDFVVSVPTNARWRIITFQVTFVTDATPGTRTPRLEFVEPGAIIWVVPPPFQFGPGVNVTIAAGAIPVPVLAGIGNYAWPIPPDLILLAGANCSTATLGIGPGDVWQNGSFLIEEWLDNV
jgi:hypothetical protein